MSRQLVEQVVHAPKELAEAWLRAFDDSLARDEFLAVFTIWVVTGSKAA